MSILNKVLARLNPAQIAKLEDLSATDIKRAGELTSLVKAMSKEFGFNFKETKLKDLPGGFVRLGTVKDIDNQNLRAKDLLAYIESYTFKTFGIEDLTVSVTLATIYINFETKKRQRILLVLDNNAKVRL